MSPLDLYVVITLFCWSVWGILDKKALEKTSEAGVMLRLYSLNVLLIPPLWVYLSYTQPGHVISTEAWFWTACAAFVQLFALSSYLVAMTITDASLVLAATASYPVVTQFLAVAILNEPLEIDRLIGCLAIALGVIGIGASFDQKSKKLTSREKVILAVSMCLATFGWGIWAIFDKKAIAYGTPLEIWFAESIWECILIAVAYVVALCIRYKVEWRDMVAWRWTFFSALSLGVGRFTFLLALSMSAASYVIAITGCYPLFMYMMALLFLKERFSKLRLVGIILIVIGGIVVQLSRD